MINIVFEYTVLTCLQDRIIKNSCVVFIMLYRSINVAILVLLSWFSYASMQATQRQNQAIKQTQQQVFQNHQIVQEKQQTVASHMEQLQESLDSFLTTQTAHVAEKKKLQSAIATQKQITRLHELYGTVLKADVLRASGKLIEATALLKSTKKGIWATGDRYSKHQKSLRGSMQIIDRLMKAWTAKDASQSAAPIYKALEKVLLDIKGKS